ncbi:cytochrome c [Novosphingobium sp. FSY-8]|uniref:Cytochrome c n=2 Tax=Novosphingobium ovatum TaxID=1908523 RepID=A0ABW9XAS9_9SPHN|nr:cytochrome c [Novosphingobium ovatum]
MATPATAATERPAPRPDPAKGAAVFAKWCAPCHAPGMRHPGTAALAAKYNGQLPPELERRSDLTPDMVALYVRAGISLMAPFRKTEISDPQLADLGAYLSPRPHAKGARK